MSENIKFYIYVLLAATVTGIFVYRKIQPPLLKWFVPFLILTVIVEAIGTVTSWHKITNLWIFNFFTCFEFLFYSYIYLHLIKAPKWKKAIQYALVIYPILFLTNIFFVEGFFRFHTITYRIGSVMVVCWCYLYFRQFMQSPGYTSVLRNPVFWISTGLLFFYTGFFFYMSAGYILLYTKLRVNRIIWEVISGTLNTLLYGCFLISFLCQVSMKKK
jgi:hypothetical protein